MRVIGLMSGTSADGIDVAVVEIDGAPPDLRLQVIRHQTIEYDPALRAEIFACFRPESSRVDRLCRLNFALGEAYAAAILQVVAGAGFSPEQIDLVSAHGQALWYDPPAPGQRGAVLTMGEGAVIAERTGITTITQLRNRDVAAGGRGAPLVSYLDWLLFRHPTRTRAIQNIGGIGNVTALPPKNGPLAGRDPITYDTGPGNMIMDYCASRATNGAQEFDADGLIAARGKISEPLLAELMAHPYLAQPAPKTTGREVFGVQFAEQVWTRGESLGLRPEDIVATVTAFTAESIASGYRAQIPFPIEEVYVAGGGALNPTLLAMLSARLGGMPIHKHDELGLAPAAKECALFALLGYEMWHGRPGTLPVFTGAAHPAILGNVTPGRLWPRG